MDSGFALRVVGILVLMSAVVHAARVLRVDAVAQPATGALPSGLTPASGGTA